MEEHELYGSRSWVGWLTYGDRPDCIGKVRGFESPAISPTVLIPSIHCSNLMLNSWPNDSFTRKASGLSVPRPRLGLPRQVTWLST